ncbi:MAG: TlyA family RNA methyltransferase [Firmicutes bacterium]|nr:TlyA family RNA methyltransferase [Bacillota bacterium]
MRLDLYLHEAGYAESRAFAKFLVLEGCVFVNGKPASKPSLEVDGGCQIEIKNPMPYVSVGGMKLDAALENFGVSPRGTIAADIGASTGGFTDCLLSHGARRVYAIDSGTSQLHEKLRVDPRVVSMENVNARDLTENTLPEKCGFLVCDVSFISLSMIFPAAARILLPESDVIALIKPQFELDRSRVGRGVVRDPKDRASAVYSVISSAAEAGFEFQNIMLSPVTGGGINDKRAAGRGNREYPTHFIYKRRKVETGFSLDDARRFISHENDSDIARRNK